MTQDDRIYRFRLRLFALAEELESVRAACRLLGVHRSTYYRWRAQLLRHGPEILRPRERRAPRDASIGTLKLTALPTCPGVAVVSPVRASCRIS